MNLPIELWMQVLESLDLISTPARTPYVSAFVYAVLTESTMEEDLVAALPEFEKRAWRQTRPYYSINKASRKAAQQTFLSGVLLRTCPAPLTAIPELRSPPAVRSENSSRYRRPDAENPCIAAPTLAMMRPIMGPKGLEPTYMAFELFNLELYDDMCAERRDLSMSLYYMIDGLIHPLETTEVLRTVKQIELIATPPKDGVQDEVDGVLGDVQEWIRDRWAELGVTDGEVRVLY